MDFRVLGPLQVCDEGRVLRLPMGHQRTLLAYLLAHRDEFVPTEKLVEELWSAPPPTAMKIVRNLISDLRRLLHGDADNGRLVSEGGGYRLTVPAENIDASRFEALTAEGQRSLQGGDPARAATVLREALALWRGPPFADLAYEPSLQREAARLEELRLVCLEARIEADLALGRHVEVVPELEGLVQREPLRERLREQLLLALYRSGRQADALAAYRDARRALVDELGLEPGRRLQELERAILSHDPSLDPPDRPRAVAARSRRAVALAVGAAALLLAAATAAIAFSFGNGQPRLVSLSPNSVGAIDPDGRIVAHVPLGAAPRRLAAAGSTVWALSTTERTLFRVDGDRQALTGSARLEGLVADLTATGDTVWVLHADGVGNALVTAYSGDQDAPLRLDTIDVGIELAGASNSSFGPIDDRIAAGTDLLWVTTRRYPRSLVTVLDASRERVRGRVSQVQADAIAGDGTMVWFAGAQLLSRIETVGQPVDLEIALPSPSAAIAVAVGEQAVWVVSSPHFDWLGPRARSRGRGVLTRVDPETAAVATTIEVGGVPVAVVAGLGSVWIADSGRRAILRIDPATNKVTDTIRLGSRPTALAVAAGRVWVAVA